MCFYFIIGWQHFFFIEDEDEEKGHFFFIEDEDEEKGHFFFIEDEDKGVIEGNCYGSS